MKNIKKFICLLIVTVLITPSIAIAEDTYSGYFNNEEITMFADTSVKISENEKSAVEDIISDLNNLKTESDIQKYNIPLDNIQELIDSLPKAIQYELSLIHIFCIDKEHFTRMQTFFLYNS